MLAGGRGPAFRPFRRGRGSKTRISSVSIGGQLKFSKSQEVLHLEEIEFSRQDVRVLETGPNA